MLDAPPSRSIAAKASVGLGSLQEAANQLSAEGSRAAKGTRASAGTTRAASATGLLHDSRAPAGANLGAASYARLDALHEAIGSLAKSGLHERALSGAKMAGSSTRDWHDLRRKYVNAAMADRSGGSTSAAVRHWLRFTLIGRRISPVRLEAAEGGALCAQLEEEALLMDFAIWLVLCAPLGRSISIDTAAKYVGTVQSWHNRHFGSRIGGDLEMTRLRDMLKGMRREIGQPARKVRYGVRTQQLAEALREMLTPADGEAAHVTLDKLNWRALLSTSFCVLLRAAEAALPPGTTWDPETHLSRADIDFFFEKGVRCATLLMRPCKQGKIMRGKTCRLVLRGGGSLLDPVEELWQLVCRDPVPKEERATTALFRTRGVRGGQPRCITVVQVRAMVKLLMQQLGEDPARFGAHSLRIGGATAALAANIDPSTIRMCGRWNSDIYEIYARATRESTAHVTSLIGSTPFSDLERGFHSEELELLPDELTISPDFDEADYAGDVEDEL